MNLLDDPNDALVRTCFRVDDGCDWNKWLVWSMRSRYRISQGAYTPAPARPQVVAVRIEVNKKPQKRRKTKVISDEY